MIRWILACMIIIALAGVIVGAVLLRREPPPPEGDAEPVEKDFNEVMKSLWMR